MSNEAKLKDRIAYLEIEINELKSENQALRDQLSIAVCGLKDIEDHWEVNESQDIARFALSRLDKFLNNKKASKC